MGESCNLSFSASGRIGLGGGCEYCKCEGIPSNLSKFFVCYMTVVLLESSHLRKWEMKIYQFSNVWK